MSPRSSRILYEPLCIVVYFLHLLLSKVLLLRIGVHDLQVDFPLHGYLKRVCAIHFACHGKHKSCRQFWLIEGHVVSRCNVWVYGVTASCACQYNSRCESWCTIPDGTDVPWGGFVSTGAVESWSCISLYPHLRVAMNMNGNERKHFEIRVHLLSEWWHDCTRTPCVELPWRLLLVEHCAWRLCIIAILHVLKTAWCCVEDC